MFQEQQHIQAPSMIKKQTSAFETYKCPYNQPAYRLCISQTCSNPAICCQDEECKCNSQSHSGCPQVRCKHLFDKIKSKIIDYSQILKQVNDLFDNIIDEISKIREDSEKCIRNYGLRKPQMDFLNFFQQNRAHKITGKVVSQANKLSSNKCSTDFSHLSKSISKYWGDVGHVVLSPLFAIKDIIQLPILNNKVNDQAGQIIANDILENIKPGLEKGSQIKQGRQKVEFKEQVKIKQKRQDKQQQPLQIKKQQKNLQRVQPESYQDFKKQCDLKRAQQKKIIEKNRQEIKRKQHIRFQNEQYSREQQQFFKQFLGKEEVNPFVNDGLEDEQQSGQWSNQEGQVQQQNHNSKLDYEQLYEQKKQKIQAKEQNKPQNQKKANQVKQPQERYPVFANFGMRGSLREDIQIRQSAAYLSQILEVGLSKCIAFVKSKRTKDGKLLEKQKLLDLAFSSDQFSQV